MRRRNFIKGTGAALAGSILLGERAFSAAKVSQADKINIGVIGCNGMGWSNTNSLLKMQDVDLIGICDVDNNVIRKRLADYAKLRTNVPKTYTDYRELLNDKDIDAVVIGTPDHWHCKIMVDAVKAGKHVYVEKPIANSIEECNIMVAAQEKTGKVVQAGQWQRSGPHYRKAIEIVRSGVLGKIRLVKVWAYQGWMNPVPVLQDSPVPEGVNYDMWLGPAPKRNFNANRFHFNFRWFWDYAGGLMTDWGVHEIDIALYAMQASAPVSVMAAGGKLAYPDDASETPDTLQAIFQYENFSMLWEHATGIDNGPYNRREGIAFIGNNGTLVVDRGGYEVIVERVAKGYSGWGDPKMQPIEAYRKPDDLNYLDLHTQNFIEAVKKNDQSLLNTPIRSGSVAAINAQMGNIAYKTGSKVFWNAKAGNFGSNKEANKLIKSQYHNGWELPSV
ncbi:Gfo/Idh/MocA family oxidoreductase [Fulvivirgaceae bacterium PWU4]|uniref:Gfo/Idh/MocA family oxidoreductase n=1 Tax=Chryseosolibacter histidini TaxID=2782349 RepID=A0AAP2DSN8_9BACT|nr:Gfo/Idh/MocA family oxidoreductase [Chryseosolibacter histidini]MBT1700603.1 Gfo/Idh/MocA family oxidoreductase [Chryseosolibacter histidini]